MRVTFALFLLAAAAADGFVVSPLRLGGSPTTSARSGRSKLSRGGLEGGMTMMSGKEEEKKPRCP